MARAPHGTLMTTAEAKLRLLELGAQPPPPGRALGSQALRLLTMVGAGLVVSRLMRRRKDERTAVTTLARAARTVLMAVAPIIIQEFARGTQKPAAGQTPPPS